MAAIEKTLQPFCFFLLWWFFFDCYSLTLLIIANTFSEGSCFLVEKLSNTAAMLCNFVWNVIFMTWNGQNDSHFTRLHPLRIVVPLCNNTCVHVTLNKHILALHYFRFASPHSPTPQKPFPLCFATKPLLLSTLLMFILSLSLFLFAVICNYLFIQLECHC